MKLACDNVFQLPTRALENYKYTDFSRLHPSLEFECSLQASSVVKNMSEDFAKLLASLEFKNYPLAEFALAYPSHEKSTATWRNKLVFIEVNVGETSELKIQSMDEISEPGVFLNVLYVVLLKKNARLKVDVLTKPDGTRDSFTSQHFEVWQEVDSVFEIFYENYGQALGRYDLHAKLMGERAVCRAFGLYRCEGQDHVDHHLLMEHFADHTQSEQFFKGTVDGKARAVFNGKAIVHSKVKHAEARQHNFNLLLSPAAEIDTKPELEVFTDVVKAAHGATVGQLDMDALFYLESRGISRPVARQMLIDGFLGDVREKFEGNG
jgi:Fe-S cluster assembly scaffold protein SufB